MLYLASISRIHFPGSSLIKPMIESHSMAHPTPGNSLGPFQVLWIPLWNLTCMNPIELSCRWIQDRYRCTDSGGLSHQHLPANLIDPASWKCPSSQVCENHYCASMSIPYRTKSCRMEANHKAPCSFSISCSDLSQAPASILSVGIDLSI